MFRREKKNGMDFKIKLKFILLLSFILFRIKKKNVSHLIDDKSINRSMKWN